MSVLGVEVTAAEMVLAGDVINLRHELLVGLVGGRSDEGELAVWTIGARNVLQEESRGLADGDLVAGERLTRGWVLEHYGDIGEVAGTLLVGGHEGDARREGGAERGALPRAEEEQFVAKDGAAGGGAELMALLRIGRLGKVIAGIDSAVADKLEKVSVKLIGAGVGNYVDSDCGIAVLGGHVVGLDVELLDGIGIWEGQVGVDVMIVVVPAIELVIDVAGATAANIPPLRIGVDAALAGRAAIVKRGIDGAGREEEQRLRLAAVEWEIDNALSIDELRDV